MSSVSRYVCMYVSMYACMEVNMYVCTYIHTYVVHPTLLTYLPTYLPTYLQGEWRREPYGARQYVPISTYVPGPDGCTEKECEDYLSTPLDGFLGR